MQWTRLSNIPLLWSRQDFRGRVNYKHFVPTGTGVFGYNFC